MKISYGDEAYETFWQAIASMDGYAADVTTIDNETIEATLHGPDNVCGWGDAIYICRVDADWNSVGEPFSVRVKEVHIH